MDATTDHRGPVVDGAGRVVRLAASVCLSDMHIPTVFLLLYGGSTELQAVGGIFVEIGRLGLVGQGGGSRRIPGTRTRAVGGKGVG